MNAYLELMKELRSDEVVEGLVFGEFGWGGYSEEESIENPIPKEKRGVVMTLEEAKPMMEGWSFYGSYGAPECYAVYIWTNMRVGWVTQYDGSTCLDWAPRNPIDVFPYMPGG